MKRTIRYYRLSQYGTVREFVHPDDKGDAIIIRQLTGKTTICGVVRELIRDLTQGAISFEEVLAPN